MESHEKINKLLAGFVLGELSQEQTSAVKSHLAECQKCSSELKRLQALLECTSRMSELSADEDICESVKQALFAAIDQEEMKTPPVRSNTNWLRITGIAAVAASVILFFSLLLMNVLNRNRTVETNIYTDYIFPDDKYKITEIDTSTRYILAEAQNNYLKETRPCDILAPLPN